MFHKVKVTALSALVALGALTALPAGAQAGNLYFGFGLAAPSGGHGYRHHDHDRRHHAERPRHSYYRGDRGYSYRGCTPRRAVEKARRFGVRHARVVDVNRRVIRVAGHKHHRRVGLIFARAPHCPVIR